MAKEARNLTDWLPEPEAILSMSASDIGLILLRFCAAIPEPDRRRRVLVRDYIGGSHPVQDYPPKFRDQITQVFLEGWQWLDRNGYIIPEGNLGNYTISRTGQQLLATETQPAPPNPTHASEGHSQMLVTAYDLHDPTMMRTLTGMVMLAGNIHWQLFGRATADQCQGVRVQFPLSGRMERRRALQLIRERLQQNDIDVLTSHGQVWRLNLDGLREKVPDLLDGLDWATGIAIVEPEIEVVPDEHGVTGERTSIRFSIYKEEYILERQQRVFLSHKGADKPQVRRFFSTLKAIGFDPWLDEDAMVAGVELERGILQGFKDSCAAVFFITPNFVDEGYLRTEINYAIAEKRSKGDRFAIITIVFTGVNGEKGAVPELLKQYVWKEPATELEAFNEILRAMPIEAGDPHWRM